jgi:hypothetical protein
MALFERFEAELVAEGKTPLSLSPLRAAVEAFALRQWAAGQSAYVGQELSRLQPRVSAA